MDNAALLEQNVTEAALAMVEAHNRGCFVPFVLLGTEAGAADIVLLDPPEHRDEEYYENELLRQAVAAIAGSSASSAVVVIDTVAFTRDQMPCEGYELIAAERGPCYWSGFSRSREEGLVEPVEMSCDRVVIDALRFGFQMQLFAAPH